MADSIGTDPGRKNREAPLVEVVDGLNDLLQLDHDAVGSYEIAIDKLEDRDLAVQIDGFRRDHERHIRDLNEVIVALGGTPKNEPHATAPLKQAIQQIAAAGGDEGVLMAWRTNELQVSAKYDSYAHQAMWWPREAKRVVDRNALDEERHYRWVAEQLGDGDSAEIGLTNRAREEMTRAKVLVDDLRGRAEGWGDQVKAVASRLGGSSGGGGDLKVRLEDEVRRNPARSLAVVFVAAFVIGRIIR